MKINVYCQDRGWLFEDLKREIASYGAKPSSRPLRNFDAYICIRTKEASLSPNPKKTVVQVHDMKGYDLSGYGAASLVHEAQTVKGDRFVLPIGTRDIPYSPLPEIPTIGFFARALNHENKGKDVFRGAIELAMKRREFAVLMIGQNLEDIAYLGKYEDRPAGIEDYSRISAIFTASKTPMIPLSAYEAIAAGRAIITTPRVFPFEYEGIFTGNDEKELSQSIIRHIDNYGLYKPTAPFKRADWCKAQIDLARGLI